MASNPKTPPSEYANLTPSVPLAGSPDDAMQRLRIGLGGLLGIVILLGLASLIFERANQIEAAAVPEAASTVEPSEPAPKSDPLADSGIVPDLPSEPTGGASQQSAIMPEQGNDLPAQ
ncbi:hypothetical protein [Altererythrobacter sp. MF3-039]|uniref:hypothetical protein n=1 Tax=Altererythrobacter sp. MF3-039 TaxID=3252901 RepID=UPI00390C9DB6